MRIGEIASDSRKFGRSTFKRSLIFKLETSAILKLYRSKFQLSFICFTVLKHFFIKKSSKIYEFQICFCPKILHGT